MRGHVYVVHGDVTRCVADAIAYSTSTRARGDGQMHESFARLDGFAAEYATLGERTWNVGDTHWIAATPRRPAIVVTFTVGDARPDRAAHAREIVTNTIACAVQRLRVAHPTKRLLVLLPTFLTGAGGARRMRQEMARYQLRAAADALADHPNVDCAFVLYQPADHDVYRDARRDVIPDALGDVTTVPPSLVRAVRDHECVMFVGSGMSVPAGMPGWGALVGRLRAATDGDAATGVSDYLAIAQTYRERCVELGLPPVREVVRELFGRATGRTPTLAHYLLASLDASNVITTNYDHLLEDTYAAVRANHLAVVDTAHVPETGSRGRVNVIKFHGDATTGADVVLSKHDYDRFFDERPAFALLLSGLLLNQTFLFVGYSLSDPNFQQIYHQIVGMLGASTRRPVVTAFDPPQHALPHVDVVVFSGEEKTTQLWRWLDRLVDDAARPSSVLLAESSEARAPSKTLATLRQQLLAIAAEIERAAKQPMTPEEARVLAQIATMLFDHGFRSRTGNENLIARLAMSVDDPDERIALLRQAASQAASREGAELVENILAEYRRRSEGR